MTIEDDLRGFLIDDLRVQASKGELVDTYPLIESEVLDSMGIFQLVELIEDRLSITIEDEEVLAENFETIEAISQLVNSKL